MDDSVSSVSDETKIRKELERICFAMTGIMIFLQIVTFPAPNTLPASSSAGSTESIAVVLPLICKTTYLVA